MALKIWQWLRDAALTLGLLPFLGLCLYNQPYWDDLSLAASARQLGVWQAQRELYLSAGGRFVAMFLSTAANPLTYGWWHGVRATALLFCLATAATIWWGLRRLSGRQIARGQASRVTAFLLLVYLAAIPDIHSSLYWFSGQVVHQLPMLLLVIIPVAVAGAHQATGGARRGWLAVAAGGTFVTGGTSELAILHLGLVLALALALSAHRRQGASLRIWALLLGVLALATLGHVAAPGNYLRLHSAPARLPLWPLLPVLLALGRSMREVLWQPAALLLLTPPLMLASCGATLRRHRPAGLRLALPLSALVLLTGLVAGLLLMLTTIGVPLLARTTNVLVWWLLLGWCVACWAALPPGSPANSAPGSLPWRGVVGALLTVLIAAPTIRAWQELLREAPRWAAQCEARLPVYAAAAGHRGLLTVAPIIQVVPRYVLVRGYDIQPDPAHPLNRATAQYFQLDSISTRGPLLHQAAF